MDKTNFSTLGILLGCLLFAASSLSGQTLTENFAETLRKMESNDPAARESGQQDWQKICIDLGIPGRENEKTEALNLMTAALKSPLKSETQFWLLRQLSALGDASVVSAIVPFLRSDTATVRDEALAALSVIPSAEAEKALEQALGEFSDAAMKQALSQAILYRKKSEPPVVKSLKEVVDILVRSTDPSEQKRALTGLDNQDLDLAVLPDALSAFKSMNSDNKRLFLGILASAHARSVLPLLKAAMDAPDESVRLAALTLAGESRDAAVYDILYVNLLKPDPVGQYTAAALGKLHVDGVNERLADQLKRTNNAKEKVVLIGILAARNAFGTASVIFAETSSPDSATVQAALDALGKLADRNTIAPLTELLFTSSGERRKEVENCIVQINATYFQDDNPGKELIEEYVRRDTGQKRVLLPLIGKVGTKAAEKIVLEALNSTDAATRTAATRALIDWPNDAVQETVYKIAANKSDPNALAATRGYIRMVTLRSDRSARESLELFKKAMALADRPDEKRLLLSRVDTVRSLDMFKFVEPYLDDPDVKMEACRAIVGIANDTRTYLANREYVDGLLDRVMEITKNPDYETRIKRYRERQ